MQLVFTIGLALIAGGADGALPRHPGHPGNVLTLWFFATPIIYSCDQANVQPYKWLFNLNPMTHLAISYQEILFFVGPFGHWKWLLALGWRSVVRVPRRLLGVRSAARFVRRRSV